MYNQPVAWRKTSPSAIDAIVDEVLRRIGAAHDPHSVVIGVSNHHVHLSHDDLVTLFGKDEFTVFRTVRQPGEFGANETVTVRGPKSSLRNVRCMGPCRPQSQVELSRTDAIVLGVDAPLTQSGHLENAAPIDIEGPLGCIHLEHGAMVAARHIHCDPEFAACLGCRDQDLIKVKVDGERGGVLDNVIVRTKAGWLAEVHLDTDEANAFGLKSGQFVRLVI